MHVWLDEDTRNFYAAFFFYCHIISIYTVTYGSRTLSFICIFMVITYSWQKLTVDVFYSKLFFRKQYRPKVCVFHLCNLQFILIFKFFVNLKKSCVHVLYIVMHIPNNSKFCQYYLTFRKDILLYIITNIIT